MCDSTSAGGWTKSRKNIVIATRQMFIQIQGHRRPFANMQEDRNKTNVYQLHAPRQSQTPVMVIRVTTDFLYIQILKIQFFLSV